MEAGDSSASVSSLLEFWRHPEMMAQFPFAHSITMTYRLAEGALEVETSISNLCAEPMPLAVGYHPYFRLDDAPRDQWKVRIAAGGSKFALPTQEPGDFVLAVTLENVKIPADLMGRLEGRSSLGRLTFNKREKEN